MVRLIFDKAGVFIDDNILAALADKIRKQNLHVSGVVNTDKNKAVIVINTDRAASEVIMMLKALNKSFECVGCNSVHFRGTLPNDVPFRCICGKWHFKTKLR